ncbi:hypothetical protein L1887_07052 [Cichorium endivia]|nr:hypothetical protein L1887_07052 [Cichorium endivia]
MCLNTLIMENINETIEVEVENKIYKIRVKEMDGKIFEVDKEVETRIIEEVGSVESSDEEDFRESSDEEVPEGFSDEEFEEAFEESIIRESSPEAEGPDKKRDNIINDLNGAFLKSSDSTHKKVSPSRNGYMPHEKIPQVDSQTERVNSPNPILMGPMTEDKNKNKFTGKESDTQRERSPTEDRGSGNKLVGASLNKINTSQENKFESNEIEEKAKVVMAKAGG